MADLETLKERWARLMKRLGVSDEALQHFRELQQHYSEPNRHYHTLDHIEDCLALLDRWINHLEAEEAKLIPLQIELAIWYHDVIYDTAVVANEAASAEFFMKHWMSFRRQGGARIAPALTKNLIQKTDHRDPPANRWEALIVSIDLATLGANAEQYEAYAEAIRKEYDWVPEDEYREGRTKVLQGFLDREEIYPEPWFREQYEAAARFNLRWEIEMLNGGL